MNELSCNIVNAFSVKRLLLVVAMGKRQWPGGRRQNTPHRHVESPPQPHAALRKRPYQLSSIATGTLWSTPARFNAIRILVASLFAIAFLIFLTHSRLPPRPRRCALVRPHPPACDYNACWPSCHLQQSNVCPALRAVRCRQPLGQYLPPLRSDPLICCSKCLEQCSHQPSRHHCQRAGVLGIPRARSHLLYLSFRS